MMNTPPCPICLGPTESDLESLESVIVDCRSCGASSEVVKDTDAGLMRQIEIGVRCPDCAAYRSLEARDRGVDFPHDSDCVQADRPASDVLTDLELGYC